MNKYKTHNCGELRLTNKGEEVRLAGWVQRIRNLGSMSFIDLRDQYGITQIVVTNNEEVKFLQTLSSGEKRLSLHLEIMPMMFLSLSC